MARPKPSPVERLGGKLGLKEGVGPACILYGRKQGSRAAVVGVLAYCPPEVSVSSSEEKRREHYAKGRSDPANYVYSYVPMRRQNSVASNRLDRISFVLGAPVLHLAGGAVIVPRAPPRALRPALQTVQEEFAEYAKVPETSPLSHLRYYMNNFSLRLPADGKPEGAFYFPRPKDLDRPFQRSTMSQREFYTKALPRAMKLARLDPRHVGTFERSYLSLLTLPTFLELRAKHPELAKGDLTR